VTEKLTNHFKKHLTMSAYVGKLVTIFQCTPHILQKASFSSLPGMENGFIWVFISW